MIKRLLLLLLLVGSTFQLRASHLMGGEITWICLPSGAFEFHMILYRDCNGVPGPTIVSLATNAPAIGGVVNMTLVSQIDVSPPGCVGSCAAPTALGGNVEEFRYISTAPVFLTGVPPLTGWYFTYDNCCRNAAIDNLTSASSYGMTLRAWMYPYNGQNTNPCFDSSPYFAESPNTIICTGYNFTYNHNAQDTELDSIVYAWDIPLDDYAGIFNPPAIPAPVPWSGGYTTNSQMPGPLQNASNSGATLNTNTGEISFFSLTSGNFVTVVKVTSFKCGQKVAEIFREIQIVLLACGPLPSGVPNVPPTLTAPFVNPITLGPLYTDTIYAGDSVYFSLNAQDFDFGPGGNQIVTIRGTGNIAGTPGCNNPPCAIVTPNFPVSGPFGVAVDFAWKTDCAHLSNVQGCANLKNVYTFVVRASDNFCPAPAFVTSTITIVVVAPPLVDEPEIRCAAVALNGDVTLTWTPPVDTFDAFYQYQLYSDYLAPGTGTYTLLDTIQIFNQLSYTHVGANAQTNSVNYYIRTKSGCFNDRLSDSTNAVIETMHLTVSNIGNGVAGLTWNPMLVPPKSSWASHYQIYKRIPGGPWSFVDSTTAFIYNDTIQDVCKDTVYYRVELHDSTGCISISSEDSATFINVLVPDPPELRCIAVLPNGTVQLSWVAPLDTASAFDGYFIYRDDGAGFNLIDSLFNYNITSYLDGAVNANASPVSYYMETRTLCNNQMSLSGNVLHSMTLTVSNAVPGTATLNWNAYSIPPPPLPNLGWYLIYREIVSNPGVWTLVDSVAFPLTSASLPITGICIEDINYRIEIKDASGCRSISTVDGDQFSIIQVPDPATLHCVAVNPNGSVTLTWVPPTDTASSFDGYFIYRANGGAYTLIDSLPNYNTTSYIDPGANVYVNGMYTYYMTSLTNCARTFSNTSDTLQTMILTVTNAPAGTASLTWNGVHNPKLTSALNHYYKIYMQNPCNTGPWVFVDSTNTLSYANVMSNLTCLDDVCFRVELGDRAGCISVSSVDNDQFASVAVPDPPTVNCVSVLLNGNVQMSYTPPLDTVLSFGGYFIYSSPTGAGGSFVLIDSVFNYNQVTYTHIGANAQTASVYYQIQTRSGCSTSIYSAPTPTFRSIKLDVVNAPVGTAALTWNAISTPPPAGSAGNYYLIYKQVPASTGPWVLIDSVLIGTNSYNEIISNLTCQDNIDYRVEIRDNSGCVSISSIDGALFYDASVPNAPEVKCVEVLANGNIVLTWLAPTDTVLKFGGYYVYSSAGTLLDSIFNYNQLSYTVVGANGNTGSSSYYLQTRSGCARIFSAPSNTISSIYLTVTNNGAGSALLAWNAIANPAIPSTNLTYNIFKQNPAGSAWVLLTAVPSATTNYTDAIIGVCQDDINYRIEIGDLSGCNSVSNVNGDFFKSLEVPDPPSLRCVAVQQPSGNVVITWVPPLDTGLKYNSYQVYTSSALAGPYTLLDSIFNYNQTSYAHTGANAQVNDVYYYMTTRTGCSENYSPGSDSLTSIILSVNNNGFGSANLAWNDLHQPMPLTTTIPPFDIYKELPSGSGNWNYLASTPNLNYFDSIDDVCSDFIAYRIEIGDAAGCMSVSTIDDDLIENLNKPDAPEIRCVSVLPTGNIQISWIPPLDTVLRFNSYHVYSSTNGINFTLVDSIFNYSQTTYTHVGANAHLQSVYYYMETRSGCGVVYSDPSKTMRSIKLDVSNGGGFASLAWNDVANPRPSTAASFYSVYQEYPTGVWTLIDTVNGNNYLDTITICSAIINYRVEIQDQSGCISVSSIDGDLFEDIIRPEPPMMDTVSVDINTHDVHIAWHPSTSGDTEWYIVRQFNGTSWDSVGFTFGINNTYFLHTNGNPAAGFERYRVQSVDSCGNRSFSPPNHRTIFAEVRFDKCDAAMIIDWTEYINLEAGVKRYEIYTSEDNQPFSLVGTVPSTELTFTHTGLTGKAYYCYYVKAIGNLPDKSSTSNKTDTLEADLLVAPEFAYLNKATVVTNSICYVECLVDTAADVSYYKLVRSERFNGPFITVSVNNNVTDPNISFYDYNANPDQTSLYYLVIAVNPCGEDVYTSNYGRTIHLTAKPENTLRNVLKWNNYGDWLAGVKFYHIFRKVNGVWDPNPIANVPFGVREFVDDVSGFYKLDGDFCYYVEAIEDFGNPLGFRDTSRSNVAQAVQEPWVYIPNAFTPGGKNPIFNPLSSFTSAADYNMQIFNRWGEKLFESDNPSLGWDGSFKDEIAPQGAYVYVIKVQGFDGTFIERTGTVTLVR